MATVDINGPSIRNSEHYGDAIHAPNADTSSNWQLGSGSRQPAASISARSTHGLPNIDTRSRSRRVSVARKYYAVRKALLFQEGRKRATLTLVTRRWEWCLMDMGNIVCCGVLGDGAVVGNDGGFEFLPHENLLSKIAKPSAPIIARSVLDFE
ncbi:hypothetical protein Tco_1129822 [Tanacetum coccineum]